MAVGVAVSALSLPARGVWIEITQDTISYRDLLGHSPQGECGLKFKKQAGGGRETARHSPQGECGLKFLFFRAVVLFHPSLPARGVWIEMSDSGVSPKIALVTPRKGSVD